jgi:hypothetical protein
VACGGCEIALSDHRVNIIAQSVLDTCLPQFDVTISLKMVLVLERREVLGREGTTQHLKNYDLVNTVLYSLSFWQS